MKKIRVMSVFGTRPEAIKMCPLVLALQKNENIESVICLTGQHREMLDQVMEIFNVRPDYDLNIMKVRQTLAGITSMVVNGLDEIFENDRPDVVLVHGDTTTSFAVALAAFYHKIPVGHVEAGLRSFNKYSPFPEEMNRTLTARLSDFHFSPTEQNRKNLESEGISKNIFITGNTVIDAFKYTVKDDYHYKNEVLQKIGFEGKRTILMTAHRRENLGMPLQNICRAVKQIADEYDDLQFIYPVHLNPAVRDTVFEILGNKSNIRLIEPIDVEDMHNLMAKSYLVLTDSGGLQEEAPSLGVPVIVLRTETERPEAVAAGTVIVAGVEKDAVYENLKRLLDDRNEYLKMQRTVNPYGDGHASERIVKIISDNEWPGREK